MTTLPHTHVPANPEAPFWRNWGGNQEFNFAEFSVPDSEGDVAAIVARSAAAGHSVRVAGSGHSFMPIVQTDHTLLSLDALTGVISTDRENLRAEIWGGTKLHALGAPLWDAGLALANQGDIDAQSLAGSAATGTKGSGVNFGSISSRVRGGTVIDGRGETVTIDGSMPDELHALQVSIGLLGVVTRLDLSVVPAYLLRESNEILHFDELMERWDDFLSSYRHFSFWLMPQEGSSHMYDLGDIAKDHAFVKLLEEEPVEEGGTGAIIGDYGRRVGRSHLIYPDATTEAQFHELEYMVPAEVAKEALVSIRDLMQHDWPEQISPIQIRWQQRDEAFLSAQYRRDTVSVSVSGQIGVEYEPFLRAVDKTLQQYDARPHWGKIHFLTPERAREIYPEFETFQRVRRAFDPDGIFLNPHLREIFGD